MARKRATMREGPLAELFRKTWRQGPAGAAITLTVARGGTPMHIQVRSIDRYELLKKPQLQ